MIIIHTQKEIHNQKVKKFEFLDFQSIIQNFKISKSFVHANGV